MVRVKPFAAIRPPKNLVTEVAAPPYDVLNSEEALAMAGEKSLLHITKPEIDFQPIAGEHEQRTYDKAVMNLTSLEVTSTPHFSQTTPANLIFLYLPQ